MSKIIWEQFSTEELAILKERQQQLAHVSATTHTSTSTLALSVQINDKGKYALPIDYLIAVHKQVAVIPVPRVPHYIRGIANLRGHITPVIDLIGLFQLPSANQLETYYLIVAQKGANTSAFYVDTIGELLAIPSDALSPVSDKTKGKKYLLGIMADDTICIDLACILDDNDLIIERGIS